VGRIRRDIAPAIRISVPTAEQFALHIEARHEPANEVDGNEAKLRRRLAGGVMNRVHPQQHPDFPSGFVPAGAAMNFCRHWSPQKKYVFPSRSAWIADASSTVIPQMGSLVSDFVSTMVSHPSWL
jgi:hypothetical protein